jgi:hypothetical protein
MRTTTTNAIKKVFGTDCRAGAFEGAAYSQYRLTETGAGPGRGIPATQVAPGSWKRTVAFLRGSLEPGAKRPSAVGPARRAFLPARGGKARAADARQNPAIIHSNRRISAFVSAVKYYTKWQIGKSSKTKS